MHDLLHPPAHRGPLIASGALVLTVGAALLQVRLDWGAGAHLAVALGLGIVLLWLALQAPSEGGAPYPHQSVLVVLALAAFATVLARLAELLTDAPDAGTLAWASAAEAALAVIAARRRRSAFATFFASVAAGVAVVAGLVEVADPSAEALRWLLLALAFAYGLVSLPLRGASLRHADQMVNAAGLAVLLIGLLGFSIEDGGIDLPVGWQFAVLAAGAALVAYAAADRAAGAAYVGAANLAVFVVAAGEDGALLWWPLLLVAIGAVMVAAGLRPRRPLPPEPDSSTRPDDMPRFLRVRRD